MRGSRKFCQRRSNFDNVFFIFLFLVDEGRVRIQIPLLAGHQRPASETPFKYHALFIILNGALKDVLNGVSLAGR